MKGLEALQDLRYDVSMSQDINYKIANDECDIIEKELKVLEIIKNKKVDIGHFIYCMRTQKKLTTPLIIYNCTKADHNEDITKEEFNILEEVFK